MNFHREPGSIPSFPAIQPSKPRQHDMKGLLLAPACFILRCSRVEALIPGARVFGTLGRMAELRSGLRQRVPQSSSEDNTDEHGGNGERESVIEYE